MCYNFAAESFLSKKFCSELNTIEVEFHSKQEKRLRGNVRTSSIARWKARVRLPIRHITFIR